MDKIVDVVVILVDDVTTVEGILVVDGISSVLVIIDDCCSVDVDCCCVDVGCCSVDVDVDCCSVDVVCCSVDVDCSKNIFIYFIISDKEEIDKPCGTRVDV